MQKSQKNKNKKLKQALKKKATSHLIQVCKNLIPEVLHDQGLRIEVNGVNSAGSHEDGDSNQNEVAYTVIRLRWDSTGGKGEFSIPFPLKDITDETITKSFPNSETLTMWCAGLESNWPPKTPVRFNIGDRVLCRIGPDPVSGWSKGRIIALHYREPSFPPGVTAPYQIWLHDGRLIYAPQDIDELIKLRPPQPRDSPSPPLRGLKEDPGLGGYHQDLDYSDSEDSVPVSGRSNGKINARSPDECPSSSSRMQSKERGGIRIRHNSHGQRQSLQVSLDREFYDFLFQFRK